MSVYVQELLKIEISPGAWPKLDVTPATEVQAASAYPARSVYTAAAGVHSLPRMVALLFLFFLQYLLYIFRQCRMYL